MLAEINKIFSDIEFYEDGHRYYHKRLEKQLISVTTKLSKYNPFDQKFWSIYKALERNGHGVRKTEWGLELDGEIIDLNSVNFFTQIYNPDDILREWRYRAELGTTVHAYSENLFNRKHINCPYPGYRHACLKFYNDFYKGNFEIIGTEIVIGNDKVAGQVDNLSSSEDGLVLIDLKTDAKFSKNSSFRMKGKLSHLDNSKFTKYSLQTSIYRRLLEINGITITKQIIIHLKDGSYHVYECPYLEQEAEIVIHDFE